MSTDAFPKPLVVDAISDVVCPWCFIGKRRLDQALAQLGDLDITVHWRPFPLDPDVPPEGVDRQAYMASRHGLGEDARDRTRSIVEEAAKDGIALHFDRIKIMPNTINAHRVIVWADGMPEQGALVERLFELFFQDGANLGDFRVLGDAARHVGLDGDAVEARLRTSQDVDRVIRDVFEWRRRGVRGVPTFLVNNRYGLLGAQDTDDLINVFRRVASGQPFDENRS